MKLEKLFEITPSISSQLESEPRESSVEIHTLNHHMEMNQGKKEDRCRRIKWWGSKEGGGKLQFPDIGRQLLDGTQPLFPGPWITHFCLCYQSFLSTLDLGKSSNQWNKWCPEELTFSFVKNFLSEYSCFIMFCQFLVYSRVDQLYVYIYPFFFGFPSYLGHHRALSSLCYTVGSH